MLRLGKAAIPETADCVRVPDKVPLDGLEPIATVIDPEKVGAVLP